MLLREDALELYHELLDMNMSQNQMNTAFMVSKSNLVYYDESTRHGVSIIEHDGYVSVHYMIDCYLTHNTIPTQLGGMIVGAMDIHSVVGLTQQVKTENRVFNPEREPLYWTLVMLVAMGKPDFMVAFHQSLIGTIPHLIVKKNLMSDNNHNQPAHQTYTAEQLAMLDNSVVPTLDIHQPLALDPSYISSTKVWHEMNNQSLPKQNDTMSLNIVESLTEKYLNARHQFNFSMVDTINEALGDETITAYLNCETELGIEDGEDNFDLVECVVYYDLHHQRPCAMIFVNAAIMSRVLLSVYLSPYEMHLYHESINALHALVLFNNINQ